MKAASNPSPSRILLDARRASGRGGLLLLIFILMGLPALALDEAPRLRYTPPLPMMMVHEIPLVATATDRSGIDSVRLFFRKRGEAEYRSLPFERKGGDETGGTYRLSIARVEVGPEGLEYYLVAENRAGGRSMKGKPEQPLLLQVAPPGPSAWEVRRRFEELRAAWQARDLTSVEALSSLSQEREAFLRQLFDHYREIAVELSMEEPTQEAASARFTIKALVDREGNSVVPGAAWSQARAHLPLALDKEGEWKKIVWE